MHYLGYIPSAPLVNSIFTPTAPTTYWWIPIKTHYNMSRQHQADKFRNAKEHTVCKCIVSDLSLLDFKVIVPFLPYQIDRILSLCLSWIQGTGKFVWQCK